MEHQQLTLRGLDLMPLPAEKGLKRGTPSRNLTIVSRFDAPSSRKRIETGRSIPRCHCLRFDLMPLPAEKGLKRGVLGDSGKPDPRFDAPSSRKRIETLCTIQVSRPKTKI